MVIHQQDGNLLHVQSVMAHPGGPWYRAAQRVTEPRLLARPNSRQWPPTTTCSPYIPIWTLVNHPLCWQDEQAQRHIFSTLLSGRIEIPDISGCCAHSVRCMPRSEERRVGKECRSRWSP